MTPTHYRTIHSQAQYKLHNTKIYEQKNYTCMQACDHITYVHNKYFNWLLSIRFSILIPGQEFLKELSTPCKASSSFARLPSVLDPIVMECSEFRAFFWAFSQSPTIPPTEDRGLWLRDCVVYFVPCNLVQTVANRAYSESLRKMLRSGYFLIIVHKRLGPLFFGGGGDKEN